VRDPSPSALRGLCEQLRRIGTRPPSVTGRAQLEEALSSKWDGVRVEAAKALSHWGDPTSVDALKCCLVDIACKLNRESAAHAIAMALYPHLRPSDLDWAVDLFVHGSRRYTRERLGLLFEAFPPEAVRTRLQAKLSQAHGGSAELTIANEIAYAAWRATAGKRPPTPESADLPRRKGWLGRPASPVRDKKRPL